MNPIHSTGAAAAAPTSDEETASPRASIKLAGHTSTTATVEILRHTRTWRIRHTFLSLAMWWLPIPIVAFIPPHIPWVLGFFVIGAFQGWNRLTRGYVIRTMHGTCPKCGHALDDGKEKRLESPAKLTCPECASDLMLYVYTDLASSET